MGAVVAATLPMPGNPSGSRLACAKLYVQNSPDVDYLFLTAFRGKMSRANGVGDLTLLSDLQHAELSSVRVFFCVGNGEVIKGRIKAQSHKPKVASE